MKRLLTIVFGFMVCSASAQSINNLNASFKDGMVVITYDLPGDNPKQFYNIEVFSSQDAYRVPLKFVTGDVGSKIPGGAQKQIFWSVAKAIGAFKGQLSFKVKAEVLPLPFSFVNLDAGSSVRRGKSTDVQWEGGPAGQNVKLELYRGSERVGDVADTKNTGQYTWTVPGDFAKGTGYTLRISDGKQTGTSGIFAVKSKIPLLLKLSPLLIGAAVIPFLGGGGGTEPTTPASEQLPSAPNPN